MAGVEYFSPSKVNLFLRVVRKREDGFHDLASLFHIISYGDTLEVTKSSSVLHDSLTCNWGDVPLGPENLVIKAFDLFRRKTGLEQHFWCHLEKRVPHGAGLGGGSGNAATALWAANELCGRPATEAQLLEWSGEIGSDISVYFSHGAAYCTGRGEIVDEITPPISLDTPMLLVKPDVGLSTPQIFKGLGLSPGQEMDGADPEAILKEITDSGALAQGSCVNDLEAPAFAALPELAALKDKLREDGRFKSVFMSGSGSTIVGFGSDEPPAWLSEGEYADLFVGKCRLMTREEGEWYKPLEGL